MKNNNNDISKNLNLEVKKSSNDSLRYSQKSENNINLYNKNQELESIRNFTKSSTYNKNQNNNIYNFENINDNQNNNINQIQKSRTCRENENINRTNSTLRLNQFGQNRLETVLETISEVSKSKVDSSDISDDNEENEQNNENNMSNENKEIKINNKIKEESANKIASEIKVHATDTRMNDSESNTANKKSLNFMSSEKTH